MKTISIVTPSFNQAPYVESTLKSVLDQNYPALEYIVIDGGSRDGSAEIIKKYADRLHYFVSERDKGHANALNKGFKQSNGEIMGWINSDDMYLPWTLKTVAKIFEDYPDIEWITGMPAWWSDEGALLGSMRLFRNMEDYLDPAQVNLQNGLIQQESVFWRRSLWDKAGGYVDETYDFMIDCELWTRFFLHADLWHVGLLLAGFRLHAKNRGTKYHSYCVSEIQRATEVLRSKASPEILALRSHDYFLLQYEWQKSLWSRIVLRRDAARKAEANYRGESNLISP